MREITHITVHHSGTRRAETTIESMRRYHVEEKGWPDLAYHLVIDWAATVQVGRSIEIDPDSHSEDVDFTGHIFVCVVGNFEEEVPTGEQLCALDAVLGALAWQFPEAKIGHHCDYAATACPGRNLIPAVQLLRPGS